MFKKKTTKLACSFLMLAAVSSGILSCKSRGEHELDETPTRGKTHISVDVSYQPFMDAEIRSFMTDYKYADITADYKPEYDVVSDFLSDSVKVIVTSYQLNEDQIQALRSELVVVRTTTIAYDALALIINKANQDSLLTYEQVQDIFLGKITSWKQMEATSEFDGINVVFDHTRSGNVRYFKEKFGISGNLPENFYAVESNEEVINYISRNGNGLGIISVNWISDEDDSLSMSLANKVKLVGLSNPFMAEHTYYLPYPGSIYQKTYPFTREVFCHSRETFAGLGSGLISWLAGEKGQMIILKSGLVPATMPARLVQMETE